MDYMSTEKTFQIVCGELADTLSLAEKIGRSCRGGEVFELISDLGGGKTAFVRGLAKGMGTTDEVTSPSFTVNNTYTSSKLTLEHFDFYRLDVPGLLSGQLEEDIFQPDTVVAVEWGDIVSDILPDSRVRVTISVEANDSRTIQFNFPEELSYLFEEMQ